VPRRIFPASTVTNATGAALRLTFHTTSTSTRRETDLWTVDGSNYLSERIPNGVILTTAASPGAYSAFAGPDDIDVLYVGANGGSRSAIYATGYVGSSLEGGEPNVGSDSWLKLHAGGNLEAMVVGVITRDANGAATSAGVVWPDGTTGTYTGTASASFPGAIDSYTVTYVGSTTKTATQAAVTRDSSGAVTTRPVMTVT
jgi:hypothetical protein